MFTSEVSVPVKASALFFFLDLTIVVDKLTTEQMHEVNRCARAYGLGKNDFMSLLTRDLDEQEYLRIAKEEEQERAMYSVGPARIITVFLIQT